MKVKITAASALLLSAFAFSCGDDDKSDDSAAPPEEEVESGDQPDAEEGRFSTPPDTTAPDAPQAFAAVQGADLGTVKLHFSYPEYVGDYDRIEVRRLGGSQAPADCSSGTLAMTITDFSKTEFEDTGLYPGTYSYRACVFDAAGNSVDAAGISAGKTGDTQRIFATSSQYAGNLKADFNGESFDTGPEGADYRCQYHADQASLGGTWRAILSDQFSGPKYRVPIFNTVKNLNNEILAKGRGDLYDGVFNDIGFDENGDASSLTTWTGSYSDGESNSNNCSEWTSTTGSANTGHSGHNSNNWLYYSSDSCTGSNALVCIEIIENSATLDAIEITSTDFPSYSASLSLDLSSADSFAVVEIKRASGDNLFDHTCRIGNSLNSLFREDRSATYTETDGSLFSSVGKNIHYYACGKDEYGNLMTIAAPTKVSSTAHSELQVFVSNATYDGNINIATADAACVSEASSAGLTGTFISGLSDGTALETRLGVTGMTASEYRYYYDVAGNSAGHMYNWGGTPELYFGGLLRTKADGTVLANGTEYWTGTTYDGAASANNCTSFSSNSSGVNGVIGTVKDSYSTFTGFTTQTCDQTLPVLCIEQPQ